MLTATALGRLSERRTERRTERWSALGLRARNLIDERLADEGLSAELICHELGMSRSTLYRQFQDRNGVEKYILERRLTLARARLSEGVSGGIGNLALDLGFKSQSHFSTAYRSRFGLRPRDTLLGSASPSVNLLAAKRVEQWERLTEDFC